MKKMMVAVVAVALALPALAWSASPYVSSIKSGTYTGTMTIKKDNSQMPVTMEVKNTGENVEAVVKTTDPKSKEVSVENWTLNDKTFIQKELDPKTNAVANQYGATGTNAAPTKEQVYKINCADAKANKCDGDVDHRYSWKVQPTATGLNIVGVGVGKEQKADLNAQPAERFNITVSLKK